MFSGFVKAVALGSVVAAIICPAEGAATSKETFRNASKAELDMIQQALDGVLKDSASAKLADVLVVDSADKSATRHSFCGKVNSKNSYGAYTGLVPMFGTVSMPKGNGKASITAVGDYPEPGAAQRFCDIGEFPR